MTDLERLWLDLPDVDLKRIGVDWRDAQMIGGIRRSGDEIILPVYPDPPSIYRYVTKPALIDLIAFHPDQPEKWRMWKGVATMLGEAALQEARDYQCELPIYRTPLAWARSGGAGAVLLDKMAAARELLFPAVVTIAEDTQHWADLQRLLKQASYIPIPEIRVAA